MASDQYQSNDQTLCPCDSGLAYDDCCGREVRRQANIVATISLQGIHSEEPLSSQLQTALDHLDTSPDLFPARINFAESQAWFVKMSPRWYRESVFLDPARIKGSCIIQTEFDNVLLGPMMERSGSGAYADLAQAVASATESTYGNGGGSDPSVVTNVILKAIQSDRPRIRYVAGQMAKPLTLARKYLGDRVFDRVVMSLVG